MLPSVLALLSWLPFASGPSGGSGDVAVFVHTPAGLGGVVTVSPSGAPVDLPLELLGIELLDVDFAGRSALLELLPGRPRRRADVGPGAARLELPGGRGSLYRFRRGAAYGLFVVDPTGRARVVLEVPGGAVDALQPTVAVSAAGDALLVATQAAAGGNLYEVLLDQGVVRARTAAEPPLSIQPGGLALLDGFGVAACADGLVRFDRDDPSAQAAAVGVVPAPPALFTGAVAQSADGAVAAAVGGDGAGALFVYTLEEQGPAERLTDAPAAILGADPFALDGPFLALSTDGSWCSWMTVEPAPEGGFTREAWSARRTPIAPAPEVALTADALVVDTLDQPGDFVYVGPSSLLLLVGELGDALGGIDNGELLRVVHQEAGAPIVTNLSLTGGGATPPFAPGELKTEHGIHMLPDMGHVLALRRDSGDGALVAVSVQGGGTQTLVPAVDAIVWAEATADGRLVVAVKRDLGLDPIEVVEGPSDLSQPLKLVLSASGLAQLGAPAAGAGGWIALREATLGADLLHRVHPATGAVQTLGFGPLEIGPGLAFAQQNALCFTAGAPGAATRWFAAWPPSGAPLALSMAGFAGRILPDA